MCSESMFENTSIFTDEKLPFIAMLCNFCYCLFYRNSNYNMTMNDSRGNGGLADVTDLCQECNFPYDKGKKRKLIDACGHEKCWACMVKQEECQICAKSKMYECINRSRLAQWWSIGSRLMPQSGHCLLWP